MTRISEEKLGEILAGCEGVQFGPWSAEQCDDGLWMVCNAGDVIAFGDPNHKEPDDELPFRYLARLDPTTVSSLVTELRELREALRPFAKLADLLVPEGSEHRQSPREADVHWYFSVVLKHVDGFATKEELIEFADAVRARAALSGAKL
jgi:hypothetical protein